MKNKMESPYRLFYETLRNDYFLWIARWGHMNYITQGNQLWHAKISFYKTIIFITSLFTNV